ncbi:DDB1- and CUL4-associated factor 15-like [Diadema antillarum]|uniref:DDB1- and CUL4-associated factor 15-like n=1 Tax=Diadema antillarum TaxID=105358 RepID=UPI003A84E68F
MSQKRTGTLKGFPCLMNTRKGVSASFNVTHRLRMRELRGCLQPTRQTYPVCRSLFGRIPGRLGIPLKAIIDDHFLTEEGHVFLGFSKDGNFVLSYTLNVDTNEHTAFPVYIYQLHWWRFNHYKAMEKVSEVGLFGEEEIQQDLYIAVCSWPSDNTKVMVYGCSTSSKPLTDEEKLLCYVTITAVPAAEPCQACLHLKYTSDMTTNISSGFNPSWLPPEFHEDLPTPAAPTCLKHGFAVHTKYELAPPFPSFSPKHSLSKDGVTILNTGYSVIALAVSLGKGSPCSSLYSPGNSSARSIATRASDVSSLRGGGNRCRDWLHSSAATSQVLGQGEERAGAERRQDLSTVPIYSASSTAITDFCNFGLDEESSDSEDLLLGTRLASGLQAPQRSSPPVIDSRDFLDILDEEDFEGADLCQFAKQTKVLQGQPVKPQSSPSPQEVSTKTTEHVSQEGDSDSIDSHSTDNDCMHPPKTNTVQRDASHSKVSDAGSIKISCLPHSVQSRTLIASPDRHEPSTSSGKPVPHASSDSSRTVLSKCATSPGEICITLTSSSAMTPKLGGPNPLQGSPRHLPHMCGLDSECRYHSQVADTASKHVGLSETYFGCHGLSPRSFDSEDFSPPTSNCPTPSRWSQTPTFRHNRPTFDNWSTCSSVSFHRLNEANDKDDIGSEIDHTCPYHHGHFDHYSQGSGRSTIRECTCKLQRFTYSVRRFVERYFSVDEPIETESFEYHSMLPLTVVGSNNMRMLLANRSLPNEGPFVEVKQLTMDAEHYMCEAIRTVAPWGRRYIAFTDYDMQVLDVCSDSCNVVIMIKCLVRAWPEPVKPKDVFEFEDDPTNETPQMYQTGFKFAWNLKTGQYQTFEVEGLQEFDQSQLSKVWNPGRALCQRIQRRWAIPQAHTKGVHVLTNEAVFKNRSLTKLLDPLHYVAIVLT